MTTTRWPQVRRILEQALEQPADAREAFIVRACNGDGDLRAEVEHLLSFESSAEALLTPPKFDDLPGLMPPGNADTAEVVGATLGAYRLTGLIAAGGMGAVYRASRADAQFDREVAIKIFTGSLRSKPAVARFHRERQILARLEHPNIIGLIDGGTTNDGRPYIVMEYVRGVSLTEYADSRTLTIRQRLELFESVCRAAQFAHQNLIVHRDLKPANILVTEHGDVKLLDFGISKLIAGEAPVTATVAAPMTIRYSSPEQVSGATITTATDVYSLGVLLYELLTGRLPYDSGATLPEAVAAVRETIPATPSSVCDQLNDELDAIALHALMKEPERRYPTVEALADDVHRYLDGQAVLAHPPTKWYLWRKAAWRYRWPLSLAMTVFVLVVVSAAVAASLAVRLSNERNAAVAAGQREVAARRNTEEINDFLAETLISADPLLDDHADLSLLKVLHDASARMEDFDGPSTAEAALHLTLARAYLNLWLARDAEPHLLTAVALLRADGRDVLQLADALEAMAEVHAFQFDYTTAAETYRECLTLRRNAEDVNREAIARAAAKLAGILSTSTHGDEADERLQEAVQIRRDLHHGDHESIADALDDLALLRARQDQRDEAMALHDRSMAMRQRLFGKKHDSYANGLETGATLYRMLDDAERAAAAYELAISVRLANHGPKHPSLIEPLLHRGLLLIQLGELTAGSELLAEGVEMAREALPPWHRTVRYARSMYGLFLAGEGRFDEAEQHLLAAYDGTLQLWGPDNELAAHLRRHMRAMYTAWDKPLKAAEYFQRSDYADDHDLPHGTCPACGFKFAE